MPSIRTNVKKYRKLAITIVPLVLAASAITVAFLGNHDYTDCQRYNYNGKLNGGTKEFGWKKYAVNICGSGTNNSHFFGGSFDAVELTITNEQGEVVAKRQCKVFWDGVPGHVPLTIGKNSITYQDDEEQRDHTISMPPNFIDRIRARLPFFNNDIEVRLALTEPNRLPAGGALVHVPIHRAAIGHQHVGRAGNHVPSNGAPRRRFDRTKLKKS